MCDWTIPDSPSGRSRHYRRGEEPCRACADASNTYSRNRDAAGLRDSRGQWMWTAYRLRSHEYKAILDRQRNVCAICDAPFRNGKSTHIDHNHACDHPGKGSQSCTACVRGILCHRCNTVLGGLDNIEWLKKAMGYLGRDDVAEIIRESKLW